MICRGADEEESNGHIRGRELENDNIIIDDNYSSDDDIPLELPFDNIQYHFLRSCNISILFYVEYILSYYKLQKYIIKENILQVLQQDLMDTTVKHILRMALCIQPCKCLIGSFSFPHALNYLDACWLAVILLQPISYTPSPKDTAVMAIPMIKSSFGFVIVVSYVFLSLIILVNQNNWKYYYQYYQIPFNSSMLTAIISISSIATIIF